MTLELYQYWAIAGFVFLFTLLFWKRTLPVVFAGALLMTSAVAFKLPDNILIQTVAFFFFIPFIFFAMKPYFKNKEADNELK